MRLCRSGPVVGTAQPTPAVVRSVPERFGTTDRIGHAAHTTGEAVDRDP
jgi:hypothetical protein